MKKYAPFSHKRFDQIGLVITVNCTSLITSWKLYNNKHKIALTRIKNTEIFTLMVFLVLKLLNCKVLFIHRNDNGNGYCLRK